MRDSRSPRDSRGPSPKPPRRRGHTRWLLITPVVALALIIAGVTALEAAAPRLQEFGRRVEGLPPLALEDQPSCIRRADDTVVREIRDSFDRGGRVQSSQVFRCPAAFEDMPVTFAGEVVGELLPRAGGAWAQINDDAYALEVGPLVGHRELHGFNSGLAVWLPDGLHERVDTVGRPARRGDVVLVRGTIHRTDSEDGGGLTLRADDLAIVDAGFTIDDPLHVPQLIVAIVLGLLATAAMVWSRIAARRA